MIYEAHKMGIRVAIYDEHKAFLDGVHELLQTHDDIEVIAAKENVNRAAQMAQVVLKPDLIVQDVGLPCNVKVEAMRRFIHEVPSVKVLALGMETDKGLIIHVLKAGAAGYVCKYHIFEELAPAIRAIVAGRGQEGVCSHDALNDKIAHGNQGIRGSKSGHARLQQRRVSTINSDSTTEGEAGRKGK